MATHTAATMPSDQKWLGQLAVLCEAITSDPDAALVKQDHEEPLIKQLQAMADGATSSTRKSRAWLSQCAVFLDVLPAYRVRISVRKRKGPDADAGNAEIKTEGGVARQGLRRLRQ